MDDMFRTLRTARKKAIEAHNREKRYHIIFKEVGLYRVKAVDEIAEIDQRAIYGWTFPVWFPEYLHPELTWEEVKDKYPMGDDARIRKQFDRKDGYYYNPSIIAYNKKKPVTLKLRNEYTFQEIENIFAGTLKWEAV